MAGKAPAYQYYADKFKAATRHLSRPARDIYREILDWMWLESSDFCSILCTEVAVRFAAQCTKREYEKYFLGEIMNPLQSLLKVEGNRYVSNGLRKEAEKHAAAKAKAVTAANARWGRCSEHTPSIPQASPKQCTPTPTPSPVKDLKPPPPPTDEPKPDAPADGDAGAGKLSERVKQIAFAIFGAGIPRHSISDAVKAHTEPVVYKAMKEAEGKAKSWKYIEAILQRWKREGVPKDDALPSPAEDSPEVKARRGAWQRLQFNVRRGAVKQVISKSGKVLDIKLYDPTGRYLCVMQSGEKRMFEFREFNNGGFEPYHGKKPARASPKEDVKRENARRRELRAQAAVQKGAIEI